MTSNSLPRRPRVVVLLSSEPHAASDICIIMQINGKNEEGLGTGRKKDNRGGIIVFWITVSVKRKFLIGRLLINLSTKSSQSQRINHQCGMRSTVVRSSLKRWFFVGFCTAFSLDSEVESNDRRTLLDHEPHSPLKLSWVTANGRWQFPKIAKLL